MRIQHVTLTTREGFLQRSFAIEAVIVSVFVLLDLHIVHLNKQKRTNVQFNFSILYSRSLVPRIAPYCQCHVLYPHVDQYEKLIGNWLFNKFQYYVIVVVIVCGVEYKIEKLNCILVLFCLFKCTICKSNNTNTYTITASMVKLLCYLKCLFPSSVILSLILSTIQCRSCWGILIFFLLLFQFGMDQPTYPQPKICHLGTTHSPDVP